MCLTSLCYGQKLDTIYFNADWEPAVKANSSFYRILKFVEESKKYEVTDFYNSGQIQMTGAFSSLSPEVKDGVFTWYKDGEKDHETVFERGRVKSKRSFKEVSKFETTPPKQFGFNLMEEAPTYPGGMKKFYKYIAKNFVYPKSLLKNRPIGKVIVNFIVEKDGSIGEAYATQTVHPLLDEEAIRVIEQMPKWEPGRQNGKPVRVAYNIPLAMN